MESRSLEQVVEGIGFEQLVSHHPSLPAKLAATFFLEYR